MKKTVVLLTAMVFALALGTSLALAAGDLNNPYNGITVFSKGAVAMDDGAILLIGRAEAAQAESAYESSGAGGLREGKEVSNGITVFSKGAVAMDDGTIELAGRAPEGNYVEGSGAGGLREGKEISNGVTVFSTGSVASDSFEIVTGPGM